MTKTNNSIILCVLVSVFVMILILLKYIFSQKSKKQLKKITAITFGLLIEWLLAAILRELFMDKLNIPLKYYYYVVYIGICFSPVSFYFMSIIFSNGEIKLSKRHILPFIVPVLSLLLLWTNDFHHLFYENYSNIETVKFGVYLYIQVIYTLSLYALSFFILIRYALRNSGFFSKQAILLFIGALIPAVINIVYTFRIFPISEYATPISFAFSATCIYFSFFKFSFIKVTPIALQRIVDRMSDSYIVIDDNHKIMDFNQPFVNVTKVNANVLRNMDVYTLLVDSSDLGFTKKELETAFEKVNKDTSKTIVLEKSSEKLGRYFNVEISSISSKNSIIGILLLFKDVTQHVHDIETIQSSQDLLVERERLASLGQMIGGIAHNLKTPIMSIAGAAEGLTDLIKEYDSSIEDPEVTHADHHDIAKDMMTWVDKVKDYTGYMSDVITAVKGQAVTMSDSQADSFTVEELVKRINILMKHELKNALTNLNVGMEVNPNIELKGNINSLVQVINNMISNAIQSYNGEPNKNIDMNFTEENSKLIIEIKDYGPGLPKEVEEKLFKEMITTKGKNGTGLGLFMSYSNIRAHFKGNITFKTKRGEGTSFFIHLPISK